MGTMIGIVVGMLAAAKVQHLFHVQGWKVWLLFLVVCGVCTFIGELLAYRITSARDSKRRARDKAVAEQMWHDVFGDKVKLG